MTDPATKRRALVTGASGFLGRQLVRHLQQAGWRVAALVRPARPASQTFNPPLQTYPCGESTAQVVAALSSFQPQAVFHLASLFATAHTSAQLESMVTTNVLLGSQILEAMHMTGVQVLVHAGTSWQNTAADGPHPVNLYAATKQAFESVLAYYVEHAGVSAITLRLYDTYGPHDPRPKLVPLLLQSLRTGDSLAMSPGEQVIDLAHVDDVCRAFLCAADLASKPTGAQVYAVSGGQRRTLRQVVATLEDVAQRRLPVDFGAQPYRAGEVMLPWDGEPLPGWAPEITLAGGFRALLIEEGLDAL